MIYSTTMTRKGQVTIPVSIRRSMRIKPGESINFKVERNNKITIEKNDWKSRLEELHKETAAHLKQHNIKPLSDEELDNAINEAGENGATEHYLKSSR